MPDAIDSFSIWHKAVIWQPAALFIVRAGRDEMAGRMDRRPAQGGNEYSDEFPRAIEGSWMRIFR